MVGTVLILGASGRFGRHAAEAFWNAGWTLRSFDRSRDSLSEAAKGVDVIVNAWNPAYSDWEKQVPGLTTQVIEAATSSGATVLIPGNLYVFGKDAPAIFAETTPHAAKNSLGRIRIDLERAYRDAGVRTILLRAGDFLDTEPSGNWFDQIMTKSLAKGRFVYPGNPDVPHAWAYLPDVANAAVALAAQRASLPQFCDVPFPGYQVTGREMAEALRRVMGQEVTLRSMSWLPLQLASPVWRFARLLLEMRYLWDKPHGLSPDRFDELVPEFRATPFDVALSRATRHIQPEVSGARRIRVQAG